MTAFTHVTDIGDLFPSCLRTPFVPAARSTPLADANFALTMARNDLLRMQRRLHASRLWRIRSAIACYEDKVIEAIDAVWKAQENFKAIENAWRH